MFTLMIVFKLRNDGMDIVQKMEKKISLDIITGTHDFWHHT